MAWNKNTGPGRWQQGGGGPGPWGKQPQGGNDNRGGGDQPPDLEELLRRSQDRLKRILPGGLGSGTATLLIIGGLTLGWLATGIYIVGPKEQGVVQRFGAFSRIQEPGLQFHLPWPVETHSVVAVTTSRTTDVGIGGAASAGGRAGGDSLMLTGDRNFLDIDFQVVWQVQDPKAYLFNVDNVEGTVRAVAASAMREVVGRGAFDDLQTEARGATADEVLRVTQQALDSYGAGVSITQINILRVDPPQDALQAARDVETAKQEKETLRNQAEAYRNKIIPEARGQAERLKQESNAYKQRVVAEAEGQTSRFLAVYEEYRKAPGVTRERMYLETMERVLGGTNKILIDKQSGGVIPYLPLPELQKTRPQGTASPSAPPTSASQGGN